MKAVKKPSTAFYSVKDVDLTLGCCLTKNLGRVKVPKKHPSKGDKSHETCVSKKYY
jgi:hypothetical protein